MKIRFPHIIVSIGTMVAIAFYLLHLSNVVAPKNEYYVRFVMLGLFVVGSAVAITLSIGKQKGWKWVHYLLFFSLLFLIISLFFVDIIGNYATVIFIVAALLFFLHKKKFYRVSNIYFSLFLYAALMIVGTIGTTEGFRFPAKTLTLLLLPLAFSCFSLSRSTLLRIAFLFFRVSIVYMVVCILYWWFNFLYIDHSFLEWITSKLHILGNDMIGWKGGVLLSNGNTVFPAFYFVGYWIHYYHPSYISLILSMGLVIGLYLFYQRGKFPFVTKIELILYILLCFFMIAIMESRIGLVGILVILVVSGLYYLRLTTKYFKTILIVGLLCFVATFVLFNNVVNQFIGDSIRAEDSSLAIDYISDNFWWGSGFDGQKQALEYQQQISRISPFEPTVQKTYTHNQFLGNMVQYGIWGLLVLLVLLFSMLRYAIKLRNYLLQMFTVFIVLFMMIEEPIYMQKGVTIFSVFLTFFVAVGNSKTEQEPLSFR